MQLAQAHHHFAGLCDVIPSSHRSPSSGQPEINAQDNQSLILSIMRKIGGIVGRSRLMDV
jgi:hypothetical protein